MTAQGNGSQHTSILPVMSASGGTPRARKTSRSDLHPDHTRTPYLARPGERYSLNLGPRREQSRWAQRWPDRGFLAPCPLTLASLLGASHFLLLL